MTESARVRVLERAFDIIECFSRSDPELTLSEICKRTGLSLATVHRAVQTMIHRGYIDQHSVSGKYKLSMKFLAITEIVVTGMDLIRVATPHLQELSSHTGQNVNLSVFDQGMALCLVNIESSSNFMMGIKVGQRLPIYAGALSKVILAFLPEQQIKTILSSRLSVFTPKTIAQKEALLAELEEIKKVGSASSGGELATGVAALAAPVFDFTDRAVAGIAISGPDDVFTDDRRADYHQQLLHTAQTISRDLGYLFGTKE